MKNWATLDPDLIYLVPRHFTPGRGGRKIKHVTVHHMAMIGGVKECVRVWAKRPASAHYCVDQHGVIGQAVWDRDTAWANANLVSNQETIAIEHSNSGGPAQDWPISEKTLEEGAHLVAAICHYYSLGRPVSGKNVRFHSVESGGATSCPYHLRPGGKYHDRYMQRAQYWYDQMGGTQETSTPKEKATMFGPEQVAALHDAKVAAQSANSTLEALAAPHASLINPTKSFDLVTYLRLMDAAVWETRRLMEAMARKQGLDPEKVIAEAIAADRGEA